MPFYTVKKDITKIKADIIVNAANTELREGGGVCGAIFAAAGAEELRAACDALAPIRTGKAVVTPGFSTKAKYIIHTAGPVYSGKEEDEKLLYSCYIESLKLAEEKGVKNIAFPEKLRPDSVYDSLRDNTSSAVGGITFFFGNISR